MTVNGSTLSGNMGIGGADGSSGAGPRRGDHERGREHPDVSGCDLIGNEAPAATARPPGEPPRRPARQRGRDRELSATLTVTDSRMVGTRAGRREAIGTGGNAFGGGIDTGDPSGSA